MGDEQGETGAGLGGANRARSEAPRLPRTNMFIAAVIEFGGCSLPVTIRNLSVDGALVEGPGLPNAGTSVRLVRGSLSAAADVVWGGGQRCGLRLRNPVTVAHWMARPGTVRQVEVDLAVRRLKDGHLPPASPAAGPTPSLEASIQELEAQLAAISDALASAPETIARHPEQLQLLDLMAQGLARLRRRVGERDSSGAE